MLRLTHYASLVLTISISASLSCNNDIAQKFLDLAHNCTKENRIEKAILYYRQALHLEPNNTSAALEIAHLLYNEQRADEALVFYRQVVDANENYPEVHYNIGLCLRRLKKIEEAIAVFKKVITLKPTYIKAYIQIANIYLEEKDFSSSLFIIEDGLSRNPNDADLHHHKGRALRSLEKYENAVEAMEHALKLNSANLTIMLDLANTLHMVDNFDRALELYHEVLQRKPNCVEALYNFGYTIKKCGNIDKAQELFESAIEVHTKALEIRPDYPLAHFSRSLSQLTLGNFEEGWPEYEYRWAAYNETPKEFDQPTWEGQDLRGKRILLYAEQGFGDTFQFVRYGKVLKEMGAYVIMQTQHRLKEVISLCPYFDVVVSDREPLPDFDYHIALMSLPMVLGTTVESVPHEIPYLHSNAALDQKWHAAVEAQSNNKKLKVGICWQGNKQYRSIYLKKEVAGKAMRLETFKPITDLQDLAVFSLQKINGTEQITEMSDTMDITIFEHFDEEEGPFVDTASIIKNLDVVITIDTSIAHLAAGLGTEVWILLPYPADWRWMLDSNDTPWYPNMKLFRQPKRGDWECVINDVVSALHARINNIPVSHQIPHPTAIEMQPTAPEHKAIAPPADAPSTENSSALADIVDAMTQHSIAMQHSKNRHHIMSLIAQHKLLQEQYSPYMEKSDEMKHLTEQLVHFNKKLWELQKKLPEDRPSLFDASFIALVHEIYKVSTLKNMVLQQINTLSHTIDAEKN